MIAHSAVAGGGPSGYLVVYNPNDANSVTIANYYQKVRGIPERNMIPYVFPNTFDTSSGTNANSPWTFVNTLKSEIASRGLSGQFQGIALLGGPIPTSSGYGSQSALGGVISTPGFIYQSPNYSFASHPTQGAGNLAFETDLANKPPATLSPNVKEKGLTFWPVTYVTYTGDGANSPKVAMASIDRAKAADGSKPNGTVYWAIGTDSARNVRTYQIPEVVPVWNHIGLHYSIENNVTWVSGRTDILGGIVGSMYPSVGAGGNAYQPGSWCDHLTSYGGVVSGFTSRSSANNGQMNITQWINAGVSGSSGTISEPYNGPGKFTHGHIHTYLHMGASLAEAYWRTLNTIAESIPIGDPLMQPFADFPQVTISAPAANAQVSGTLQVTASAQPTGGKTLEANLDLFVDGRRIAVGQAGETVSVTRNATGFLLNTSTLSDGWHELRVAAYNADALRTQAETAVNITVNNQGQSLALAGPATVNRDGMVTLTATPAGGPAFSSIEFRLNGRLLGTTAGTGGSVNVSGLQFPYTGTYSVYAVGKRASGGDIVSAPLNLTTDWPVWDALNNPAIGPALATIRYFASTKVPTGSTFDWDNTAPTSVAHWNGDASGTFSMSASTVIPGISLNTDYSQLPGYEATIMFYAPSDDWYEFGFKSNNGWVGNKGLTVDGHDVSPSNTPLHLAPGWHRLQVRANFSNSGWNWSLWERGGYDPYYDLISTARAGDEADGTAGTPPAVASVTAAPSTIVGTTSTLTASATNPAGDDAALLYSWSVLSGPASVTFSDNGTNTARQVTATFKKDGAYVLRLRVAHGTASAYGTVNVTVQQTATKLAVTGPGNVYNTVKTVTGDSFNVYAQVVDQFGYPMSTQPTITWSTTNTGGTVTPTDGSGRTARFHAGTGGGGTITAKATVGALNLSATLGGTLSVAANTPPTCAITVSRSSATAPIELTLTAIDAEDTNEASLTYKWEVVSTPAGKTFTLANNYYPYVLGTPSGPGTYQIKATATDGGGLSGVTTISFTVATDGTVAFGNTPKFTIQPVNKTVPAENTTYNSSYCFQSYAGATSAGVRYQWQFSSDEGLTWQNVSDSLYGAHGPSFYLYLDAVDTTKMYPLNSSDSGKLFRVIASNTSGSAYGNVGRLTVSGPAAGLVELRPATASITRDAAQMALTLKRAYGSTGAISISYRIDDSVGTAKYGVDYGLPTSPAGATVTTTSGVSVITGTVQWADKDAADKQILIPILTNSPSRESRTLNTTISGTSASLYVKQSAVTIVSDVYFDESFYPVQADDGFATLTLNRQPSSKGSLAVNYAAKQATGDTAIAGSDFVAATGSISWADGDYSPQTISIPILQNTVYKNDRTFSVQVSLPGSPTPNGMASAQVSITDATPQLWQRSWWPQTSDPAIVGDPADPDGDGIANIVERAMGTDPTVVSATPAVRVAGNRLQITFTRARDAADVVYHVEASNDLGVWTDIWNSIGVPYGGDENPTEEITVPDTMSLSDPAAAKRFLRLRISHY